MSFAQQLRCNIHLTFDIINACCAVYSVMLDIINQINNCIILFLPDVADYGQLSRVTGEPDVPNIGGKIGGCRGLKLVVYKI